MTEPPIYELIISIGNLKPKSKRIFKPMYSVELCPCGKYSFMSSSESEWRQHCPATLAVVAVVAGVEAADAAAEETAVAAASVTLLRYALPWFRVSASPD